MPRKLSSEEPSVKIEVKMPASLKRGAEEAAQVHGDGDTSSWVRGLIRAELARLGISVRKRKDAR